MTPNQLRASLPIVITFTALVACLWCPGLSAQTNPIKPELVAQYGHDFTIASLTSDGGLAVTSSFGAENRVRLWDFSKGSLIRLFEGDKAVLSSDGKFVAASSLFGPAHVFETSTGISIAQFDTSNVVGLAASQDGSLFAIADQVENGSSAQLKIYLWDIRHRLRTGALELDMGPANDSTGLGNLVLQLALGPDARSLMVGTSNWVETWDLPTRRKANRIDNLGRAEHIAFSPDGLMFAAASANRIRIMNTATGNVVNEIEQGSHDGCIGRGSSIALSPTRKEIVAADNCIRMWSYETGRIIWSVRRSASFAHIMGAPVFWKNGQQVLVGNTIFDTRTGTELKSIGIVPRSAIYAATREADGLSMVAKYPNTDILAQLWDIRSSRYTRASLIHPAGVEWPWAVSQNMDFLVTSTGGSDIGLRQFPFQQNRSIEWVASSRPAGAPQTLSVDPTVLLRGMLITGVFAPVAKGPPINSAVFCKTNKYAAIGGNDYTGRLIDLVSTREVAKISVPYPLAKVALSDDCRLFGVGGGHVVKVLDLDQHELQDYRFDGPDGENVSALTFSADNQFLIAGSNLGGADGSTYLWNRKTGGLAKRLTARGGVTAVAFSGDGKYALAGHYSGDIVLWDLQQEKEMPARRYPGEIVSAQFLSTSHHFFVSGQDGTIQLWDASGTTALATMEFSADGTWTVVAPDGRFDTNNLLANRSLRWVLPDRPMEPLPLELFMREYFEPQLLAKLMRGITLPSLPRLSSLNLAQPSVEIVDVRRESNSGDSVNVRVKVKTEVVATLKGESSRLLPSGAYDLRLFRDGQLVGRWPKVQARESVGPIVTASDREAWRTDHQVKLDAGGVTTITFPNVRLPQRPEMKKVSFTAYAFNSDRVKSVTTQPYEYTLPLRSATAVRGKAYVVTMGVNANQSHNLDLELAVSSAERVRALLRGKLRGAYSEVVEVPLYSDLDANSNQVRLKTASKADLKAVLDLLADRPVNPSLRDEVDPKHQLRAAGPDDAVVLYVASHGYADPQGTFYLMPYDTGANWGITEDVLTRCRTSPDQSAACKQAEDLLAHSVSSSDLTLWWSGVDAGEMVMILDSCHSGAVPGKEFRPGPLGDPGFGQLSYDKGMVILSASQPAQTEQGEWVSGGEGRTLLVDALEDIAKGNPQQTLEQWLQGTEQQLPIAAKQLYPALRKEDVQLPVLLDFSKKARGSTSATQ
jgi:WD40 repeat protein